MSNEGTWAAPGGDDHTPGPQQPRQPQPAPQPYQPHPPQFGGGPQLGGPQFGAPPPGWAPPPKPGLIPLRPLTLGDILGAAFRVFRRNPRPTLGTSLLFQVATFVLTVGVIGGAFLAAFNGFQGRLPSQRDAFLPGAIAGVAAAAVVPVFLSIAVQAILQGIFVIETSHQVVGEKMRLGGLLRQARGRIWALIGWVLLLGAATAVAFALVGGVVALLVALGGRAGTVVGILIGVFGFLGIVVVAVWVGVKTSLVPSVLVLERRTLGAAIARSWRLTQSSFWRTFGIIALVTVIVSTASGVASGPVNFLAGIIAGILSPNGDASGIGAVLPTIIASIVGQFVTVVIGAIGSVIQASTIALLYIDIRIRREALDLDLVRYTELRSSGVTPLPDPYRPAE